MGDKVYDLLVEATKLLIASINDKVDSKQVSRAEMITLQKVEEALMWRNYTNKIKGGEDAESR